MKGHLDTLVLTTIAAMACSPPEEETILNPRDFHETKERVLDIRAQIADLDASHFRSQRAYAEGALFVYFDADDPPQLNVSVNQLFELPYLVRSPEPLNTIILLEDRTKMSRNFEIPNANTATGLIVNYHNEPGTYVYRVIAIDSYGALGADTLVVNVEDSNGNHFPDGFRNMSFPHFFHPTVVFDRNSPHNPIPPKPRPVASAPKIEIYARAIQ